MEPTKLKIPSARLWLTASLLLLFSAAMTAQDDDYGNFRYERNFYFQLDNSDINEDLDDNRDAIDSILTKVYSLKRSNATNIKVHVTGSASLEASEDYNYRLAERRTDAITSFLRRFKVMEGVEMHAHYGLYDWSVLYAKVNASNCPGKEQLLGIIASAMQNANTADCKERIKRVADGEAYRYIEQQFFRFMRYCNICVSANLPVIIPEKTLLATTQLTTPQPVTKEKTKRGLPPVALRTNLLYDAATFLNIGADVYVTNNISIGASWMYSWWKTDRSHIYVRGYGGDVHADYWLDPTLKWNGHHLGIYGQMGTYDLEWKHQGVLAPKWLFGGGLSYGYAQWLSNRLRIDGSIGIGYATGDVMRYSPNDDNVRNYTSLDGTQLYHDGSKRTYFLESSKKLHWVGPTKLEISLIWILNK